MFNDRYINAETQDTIDFISDNARQRERYLLKPLGPEHFSLLKKELPFVVLSKGNLSELNPLLPKDVFGKNREVDFIKLENQKFSNIGLVALGEFHSNDSYEAETPDSINLYIGKRDEEGKIVLWRDLKTTPGFEKIYKFGNSHYAGKQMIVPGARGDHRGSTMVGTNNYEIIQMVSVFFKNASDGKGKEYKIVKGILEDDYSVMDYSPIYKKSDTWSVKNNELASGKLENIMFTSSQIHDADFLKTKTSMGEQYMVSKKLDNEVFDIMSSGFKRSASKNRVGFFKYLAEKKKERAYSIPKDVDDETKKRISKQLKEEEMRIDDIAFLKEVAVEYSTNELKKNFNSFGGLKLVFGDKEIKESKRLETLRQADKISGRDIDYLMRKNKTDYLYKQSRFKEELYKLKAIGDAEKKEKYGENASPYDFDSFKFDKKEVKKIIDDLEEEYKDIEKHLTSEIKKRAESKFAAAYDRRYSSFLKSAKTYEDKTKMLGIIERDIMREFYDKYNEKIDLYEIMIRNRKKTTLSEVEAIADRVQFKYDSKGKIIDAEIKKSKFNHITDLSKNADLKWGYYKAKNSIGAAKFDALSMNDRLKLARGYKKKNKSYEDLFKKHSEKTMLGKYDFYDNFNRSKTDQMQYNLLDDALIARTNDKVLARMGIDNSLSVKGSMRYGKKLFRLNLRLDKDDGFNKNDYIKEVSSQRQASFKNLPLEVQKYIESQSEKARKVYKLDKLIGMAQEKVVDKEEFEKLNKMKSFLQGQKDRTKSNYGAIWGIKNNELIYLKDLKHKKNWKKDIGSDVIELKDYNIIYDKIVDYLQSNYKKQVGYALYDVYREKGFKDKPKEELSSLSDLRYDIIKNYGDVIDNHTFMAILNGDQIINTSGASKQTSLVHGNSYLGHLGFAQPGLAWNKVTQRTFQAQDILGEQSVMINGKEKTVSQINTEIIKRLGFSGVNQRNGQYVTDNLYKDAVNRMNRKAGMNNSTYRRGETYKTFAIGDTNSVIGKGINHFNASFQEGMTAARSMILTTNSIRNKQFNLNINEMKDELLEYFNLENTKQLHEKLLTQDGLDEVISKVLDSKLHGTIEGRKKYEEVLTKISDENLLKMLDSNTYKGMLNYYNFLMDTIGAGTRKQTRFYSNEVDNEENRMSLTKAIYDELENLRDTTGAVALPFTSKGKNIITNKDYVKTHNELKPEYGFSIKDYGYNAQTGNIEVMLENIGINSQGSKGQTNGAKFTISEKYDFLKIRSKNREEFIDAVFNNKAEKRTQTGMIMHTALQTVFTNVYESADLEGVRILKDNMEELLKDMGVNIIINEEKGTYRINETYLTTNPHTNKIMTVDEFEKYMREPTENTYKLFTERGKKILDNLIDKYSSQYNDGKSIQNQAAHVGILNAMTKAYSQTYKDLGKEEVEFMRANSVITGYADGEATEFGSGNFWLLKLSSERVNSTASKKKESGLKISREMSQRQIAAGYHEMIDYTEKKNKKRLSAFLGDVFNTMSNSELLKEVHKHRQDFDIAKLNLAISESLNNGILFNLDSLKADDYLFDDKEVYLTHERFLSDSILGKLMSEKGLGNVVDGKMSDDVNIVINDSGINNFTKQIKGSIQKVRKYYENAAIEDAKYEKAAEFYSILENMNFSKIDHLDNRVATNIDVLSKNKAIKNSVASQDIYRTVEFLKLVKKNAKEKYSLEQLETILKTGNIITTINLGYDVDEATDQIVSSKSFAKLRNIARKNFEMNNLAESQVNFIKKIDAKDESIVEDIYKGMINYYSGNSKLSEFELYGDLFKELNFSKQSNATQMQELQNKVKGVHSLEHIQRVNIDSANKFLQENYSKLGFSKSEYSNLLERTQEEISNRADLINARKKNVLFYLQDKEVSESIKGKIHNTLFGTDRLNYGKNFKDFYSDKIQQYFDSSFELLDEYIKVPEGSENLFKKKGGITDKLKFKVDSSFVANPLEGSNLLNKFEELMFKFDDGHTLKGNLTELQEFIGSDIVNEKLFKDENNFDWLEYLENNQGKSGYKEGLEKARKVFSQNLSEIAEVTITDKRYLNAFRRKKYEWKDFYNGSDFEDQGFVREVGFLSRHPQQTINHMGAVMNITVDSESSNLTNRFARATLTYLPKEKNNAGVITLGKKTMLYRRGDHDGDKIQLALLDFIQDSFVKKKTEAKAYFDFQVKNHSLGEWNEAKGRYDSFRGSILVDGELVQLSENREIALEQIHENLKMDEEQLNMFTKSFDVYSHAVKERARKELKKHYNSIYEMMAELRTGSVEGPLLTKEQANSVEKVVDMASDGIKSSISLEKIRGSKIVMEAIKNNNPNVKSMINDMDLVGQTATYLLRRGESNEKDIQSLYSKTMKEIDKFISRANFDEFYKESNTKQVFDELTGQRNTGLTHSYATKLMMASVELSKIDPLDVMVKIGEYANNNTDINLLSEMKRKQDYYSRSMDLLVDNMIESAISAKHGLTLGGLEGSKIFINELLDMRSNDMNTKVIKLFDDTFIGNNQQKMVNLLENMAFYKTEFDKRNGVLDNVIDEVVASGLDKKIFMKQFDLGTKEFRSTFGKTIDEKDIRKYLALGRKYKTEVRHIEMDMFKHTMDKKYVDPDEFKIYQGLNLFGELLIQNDPGLEYDTSVVNELFDKYNKGEIDYNELIKNSDIKNLRSQVQTSLGSAASISNVGKMRDYLTAFVSKGKSDELREKFISEIECVLKKDTINSQLLKKYSIEDIFTNDYTIDDKFINKVKVNKNLKETLEKYSETKKNLHTIFYNKVVSNGSDPMGAYLEILNKNYTLFNHSGKSGSESLELLKDFKDNGIGSLNESTLSESLGTIDELRNNFLTEFVERYKEYDPNFSTFNTDDLMRNIMENPDDVNLQKTVIDTLNKSIDDTLFFKYKSDEELSKKYLRIGYGKNMTKFIFTEKLNPQQEKLVKWGKAYKIYPKATKTTTPIDSILNALEKDSNRNFIIDDFSYFYNKGKFDKKRFNKIYKIAQDSGNLFFSESVAKRYFKTNNIAYRLLKTEERNRLAQDLLNAKKFLNEDFTRDNILKRMNLKFDSELASVTAASRFINSQPKLNNYEFKKSLSDNLRNILEDFKTVDSSISNDYVNPNYIKMAKTYVDAGRDYISIGNTEKDIRKMRRTRNILRKITDEQKGWFEKHEIEMDLFTKLATSEIINQKSNTNQKLKEVLMNVATAMKGGNVSDMDLKYNPVLDNVLNELADNKKLGIAALLASGALAVGGIIKPFFANGNGTYTLSKNVDNLSEKQIVEKLNFSNGLSTNMVTEELKGITTPNSITINDKEFF